MFLELAKKVENMKVVEQDGYIGMPCDLNHDNRKSHSGSRGTTRYKYHQPNTKSSDYTSNSNSSQVHPWSNDGQHSSNLRPFSKSSKNKHNKNTGQGNGVFLNCEDRSKSCLNILVPKTAPVFMRSRSLLNICGAPKVTIKGANYFTK